MDTRLPRILSPNLGCPVIVSPKTLSEEGFDVVIAEPAAGPEGQYEIVAKPSCSEGLPHFSLDLCDRKELQDPGLPPAFDRLEQTRFLISTTLSASIFGGKARFVRFFARPRAGQAAPQLRSVSGHPRLTLYDLVLKERDRELFTVLHALALRAADGTLRFIHATDPHVALRNDIYKTMLNNGGEKETTSSGALPFINFNDNLRGFIQYANELADRGELDFVLLLGDLVDFPQHRYSDRDDYGENNWRVFRDIVTGSDEKRNEGGNKPGLKVPLFTSTGNHDWRFYPYPPALNAGAYGLDKKSARWLSPFWADDPEEMARKTKEFYQRMIGEGALLSNIMLGGKYLHKVGDWLRGLRDKVVAPSCSGKVRGNLLDWSLPRMATWQIQVAAPLTASGVASITGASLGKLAIVIAAVSGVMNGILGFVKFLVRWKSPDLMALEAGWKGLVDYFLLINPHFNYAFRVDRNYFLILDTGYDCLRAQRFWDCGRKKLGPITIGDNILGGSPDSMSFFDANEFYPYGQISWLGNLLALITRTEGKTDGPARIFVGLHAPPVNLSSKDRKKADEELKAHQEGICLQKPYNVRYGSLNHYLSQFYHLCLGRVEGQPDQSPYRGVTMALAGHAHWTIECSLRWDADTKKPAVYYARYTADPKVMGQCVKECWPLLLQTPAVGPPGEGGEHSKPPYFRRIEVDAQGTIKEADVKHCTSWS